VKEQLTVITTGRTCPLRADCNRKKFITLPLIPPVEGGETYVGFPLPLAGEGQGEGCRERSFSIITCNS
jgi:hypothetical protein